MRNLQGLKRIAKETGLTGAEAKNIFQEFQKRALDVEAIDWETIGQDLYGHGSRTGGVKHHLAMKSGVKTRRLELGGGSGMTLCDPCLRKEVEWRKLRNKDLDPRVHFRTKYKY